MWFPFRKWKCPFAGSFFGRGEGAGRGDCGVYNVLSTPSRRNKGNVQRPEENLFLWDPIDSSRDAVTALIHSRNKKP